MGRGIEPRAAAGQRPAADFCRWWGASGSDVLKLLALGADAVLVGRPLVIGVMGGGREGVAFLLNKLKSELIQAMLLTGTADVKSVPRAILYGPQ